MAEVFSENFTIGMLYKAENSTTSDPLGLRLREPAIEFGCSSPSTLTDWTDLHVVGGKNINGALVYNCDTSVQDTNYSFRLGAPLGTTESLIGTDNGDLRRSSLGDFVIISDQSDSQADFVYGALNPVLISYAYYWYPRYNFVSGTKFTVVDSAFYKNFSGIDYRLKAARFRQVTLNIQHMSEEDFSGLWDLILVAGKRYLCYLGLQPYRGNYSAPSLFDFYSGLGYISGWGPFVKTHEGYNVELVFDIIPRPIF